ncbi:unnamed protein product [Polarella glacialis]|uniref:Uncharacterized protein n=1 Tax=Polarella glacialis TaxID=89957 RepID=A0A813EIA3_POLGL|nr:unnamed protein product [Polarella glacialis]
MSTLSSTISTTTTGLVGNYPEFHLSDTYGPSRSHQSKENTTTTTTRKTKQQQQQQQQQQHNTETQQQQKQQQQPTQHQPPATSNSTTNQLMDGLVVHSPRSTSNLSTVRS